jgi:hypothetical protein
MRKVLLSIICLLAISTVAEARGWRRVPRCWRVVRIPARVIHRAAEVPIVRKSRLPPRAAVRTEPRPVRRRYFATRCVGGS